MFLASVSFLLVLALVAVGVDLAYKYIPKFHAEIDAKVALLKAQTAHVEQTAAAEALNAEKTIKAYEQQGANKLRTELARIASDFEAVQAKLGFKLTGAIGLNDPKLQTARDITAKVEADKLFAAANVFASGNPTPSLSCSQPGALAAKQRADVNLLAPSGTGAVALETSDAQ